MRDLCTIAAIIKGGSQNTRLLIRQQNCRILAVHRRHEERAGFPGYSQCHTKWPLAKLSGIWISPMRKIPGTIQFLTIKLLSLNIFRFCGQHIHTQRYTHTHRQTHTSMKWFLRIFYYSHNSFLILPSAVDGSQSRDHSQTLYATRV